MKHSRLKMTPLINILHTFLAMRDSPTKLTKNKVEFFWRFLNFFSFKSYFTYHNPKAGSK
jgi:hypothetical protein